MDRHRFWYIGFDAAKHDMKTKSFKECRDAFNLRFPICQRIIEKENWEYAKGYIDALLDNVKD